MAENLFFKVTGQGIPLVCLHAFPLDHTVWNTVADILRSLVMVILPDLRGHGASPSPSGKYSMREMGEDVIAVLDSLKIEEAFIAGQSLGGYVALAIAKYYPEKLSGLALVASHAFADSPEKKKSRLEDIRKVRVNGPKKVLAGMPKKLSKHPEIQKYCQEKIDHMDNNGVKGVLAGMAEREESVNLLQSWNKPVGIIAGKDDQYISIETNRQMAEMIKPSVYFELENCGHMPMMENPEKVAQALISLLFKSKEIYL